MTNHSITKNRASFNISGEDPECLKELAAAVPKFMFEPIVAPSLWGIARTELPSFDVEAITTRKNGSFLIQLKKNGQDYAIEYLPAT